MATQTHPDLSLVASSIDLTVPDVVRDKLGFDTDRWLYENFNTIKTILGGDPTIGVYEIINIPASGINPAGSARPPTVEASTGLLLFETAQINTIAGGNRIKQNWIRTGALVPFVIWTKTDSTSGAVVWQFEWELGGFGEVITFANPYSNTSLKYETYQGVDDDLAGQVLATQFDLISTADLVENPEIVYRLNRLPADANDTYANNARLLSLNIAYQIDRVGSYGEL